MKFGLPPGLKGEPEPEPPVIELVEPTADEARNGWTAETLTEYLAERAQEDAKLAFRMFDRKPRRSRWANSKYSPFRWRART